MSAPAFAVYDQNSNRYCYKELNALLEKLGNRSALDWNQEKDDVIVSVTTHSGETFCMKLNPLLQAIKPVTLFGTNKETGEPLIVNIVSIASLRF